MKAPAGNSWFAEANEALKLPSPATGTVLVMVCVLLLSLRTRTLTEAQLVAWPVTVISVGACPMPGMVADNWMGPIAMMHLYLSR